jgi:type I restriction enzyme, S subunit
MSAVDGWEYRTIDDLCVIDQESLGENTERNHSFYYIDISSVSEGKLRLPGDKIIFREAPSRARKVVHRGDVLMSTVRPNLKAFVYFDHTDDNCVASTGFAILTARDQVDARFILHSILSDEVMAQIESLIVGSNYPAISSNAVRRLKVLAPSYPEQAKIAEILSTVDRAIEQTEALIAKQQRIKTGLMQDLLTRGIDEHGNLRSEQTHQFKDSPRGRIPMEWEVVQIEAMCSDIVDCPHSTPVYEQHGVPCVRTADMEPGYLLLDTAFCVDEASYRDRVSRLVPQFGDVIYSREGERLGIASPVGPERVCLGQRVMLLRPDTKTDPDYLLWSMNAEDFYLGAVSGLGATTSPHINVKDIRKAQIKRPHTSEQRKIGRSLSMHHNQLRTNQERLLKLSRLKTGLMEDLLTGKKRVTPTVGEAARL